MTDTAALRVHGDRIAPAGTLDFAVNVWPAPRPAWLRDALVRALDGDEYPDDRAAVHAIARRHARPEHEVLAANGACDAIWLLAEVLRPRVAACVHPSFTEPEAALRAVGAAVTRVQRGADEWRLVARAVPHEADVVVLGNPNNPTGTLDAAETIASLARPGRVLVVDESFMDFVPGDTESLAHRGDIPGLVVVRSLTKLWSLAGIRAGYLLGPAPLVARLAAHRQPWSVNALACAALEACSLAADEAHAVATAVGAARSALVRRLERLPGVRTWRSAANFLLLEVADGPRVRAALLGRGIAVRPAETFPGLGANHLRIAVRTPRENAVLADELAEVLAT